MPDISHIRDNLSDVLSLVQARGQALGLCKCSAPWSFAFFGSHPHFHIPRHGAPWLAIEGMPPTRLKAGDLALLPAGKRHVLSSELGLKPVPIEVAIKSATRTGFAFRLGGGGEETEVVLGNFTLTGLLAPRFLAVLPPLIHIEEKPDAIGWVLPLSQLLVEEACNPGSGSAVMIARMLDLLFIKAIRAAAAGGVEGFTWLNGLRDRGIGKALSAMHVEPHRPWTVESLAAVAGLSRSAFSARFVEVVGLSPRKYLASSRLNLAAHHLSAGILSIAEIALMVGYGSEAALTRAFKAQFKTTPGAFRRASWRDCGIENAAIRG